MTVSRTSSLSPWANQIESTQSPTKQQTHVRVDGQNTGYDAQGKTVKLDQNGLSAAGDHYLSVAQRDRMVQAGEKKDVFGQPDAAHRMVLEGLKEVYFNGHQGLALQDGKWTAAELREHKALGRNYEIAKHQVKIDDTRRYLGHIERMFAGDGKLTPPERDLLKDTRAKLETMEKTLKRLERQDAKLDKDDAAARKDWRSVVEKNKVVIE